MKKIELFAEVSTQVATPCSSLNKALTVIDEEQMWSINLFLSLQMKVRR